MSYNRGNYFSVEQYIDILKKAETTLCVKDYKKYDKGLIVRHDVDWSIETAYELFLIEKDIGVISTYYLLLTSELYNPFSKRSRAMIEEMLTNGFEIGIHFDITAYSSRDNDELLGYMQREIDMFDRLYDYKIESYSMHGPSLTNVYLKNHNMIDAYNPSIFNNDCYISDSSFSFRGKNPYEFVEMSKQGLVQFLTHPDQYFSKNKISHKPLIRRMVNDHAQSILRSMGDNSIFQQDFKSAELSIKDFVE